jgi:hypothetical protein
MVTHIPDVFNRQSRTGSPARTPAPTLRGDALLVIMTLVAL